MIEGDGPFLVFLGAGYGEAGVSALKVDWGDFGLFEHCASLLFGVVEHNLVCLGTNPEGECIRRESLLWQALQQRAIGSK